MVSITPATVVEMLSGGRYGDALSAWRLVKGSQNELFVLRVIGAELLERTGDIAGAVASIEALPFKELSDSLRTRTQIVLGDCARHNGRHQDAVVLYERAASLARSCDDWDDLCWARLKVLLTAGEFASTETLVELLRQARHDLVRHGSALHFAALHVFVAQIETQRGQVDVASKHLRSAAALSQIVDNEWLTGSVAVADLCICLLIGDIEGAARAAVAAERSVAISGHSATRMALECNRGHLFIAKGDLDQAQRCFDEAIRLSADNLRVKAAVLDGLARAKLHNCDLVGARETLSQLDAIILPEQREFFEYRSSFTTRARLLICEEQFCEAIRFIDEVLAREASAVPDVVDSSLWIIRAEAAGLDKNAAELLHSLLGVLASCQPIVSSQWQELKQIFENCQLATDVHPERTVAPSSLLISMLVAAANINEFSEQAFNYVAHVCSGLDVRLLSDSNHKDASVLVEQRVGVLQQGNAKPVIIALDPSDKTRSLVCSTPRTIEQFIALMCASELVGAVAKYGCAIRDASLRAALWDDPEDAGSIARAGAEQSPAMASLRDNARRVSGVNITVLITGETGVGKEVLARYIHQHSPRAAKPFLPYNCTTVPRDMLDSQLFGYRRGAFTGAHDHFPGVIRAAAGGTLFLDEIGEVGLDIQPKLLRFLEAGEIHPIGEPQPLPVDVRVIAATNADLDRLVADGRFREDLFYRLNVVRFRVPPLRERREEIPLLVHHFVTRSCQEFQKDAMRVSEETMEYLLLYSWPGNVRQLANELRRMVALAEPGAVLMPEHLSADIAASRRTIPASDRTLAPTEVVVRLDQPMAAATAHLERAMLQYALREAHGHLETAARLLGLSRKGLYLKRHRLGFESDEPSGPGDTPPDALEIGVGHARF